MPKLIVGSEEAIVWISEEDYEDALKYKWTLDRKGYPWGWVEGKRIYLHRWVADRKGLALDQVIDHIDRDPKNARRGNLRYANQQLNCFNKGMMSNNTSGYKGVRWNKRRKCWAAQIGIDGIVKHLGHFDDPISAAVAYDLAALELFGEEFAHTNLKEGVISEEDYARAKPARVSKEKRASGKTGYRGVAKNRKKYQAQVRVEEKIIYIGTYSTPLEAARAYDNYILENGLDRATNASLGLL